MDDILIVGCGGAGCTILRDMEDAICVPVVYIDSNCKSSIQMVPDDISGCFGDTSLATTIALDNTDAIRESMAGHRVVMVFSILGGGTGTGMMPVIIRCARECGCRVVSVVGIPMVFEEDRRERALRALPDIVSISDRMLILDIESAQRMNPDVKFRNILMMVARSIAFSVHNLAYVMNGPFFSTFSEKVYTFAYVSDMDPANAVRHATEASMFETDPAYGKTVVMVSSGFGIAEMESIYETVVGMTGIIPDIVKREDMEDTKVLVFLPVRL